MSCNLFRKVLSFINYVKAQSVEVFVHKVDDTICIIYLQTFTHSFQPQDIVRSTK